MIAALENLEVRKHAVPLTLRQYHTLVNKGAITNDVESIEGALIEKIPMSPLHEFIILRLFELIQRHLLPNLILRKEAPISIENSEPEPEISVTSHNIDFAKADIYARAQIPEYLILDAQQCRAVKDLMA